jgi:hypothetical protein
VLDEVPGRPLRDAAKRPERPRRGEHNEYARRPANGVFWFFRFWLVGWLGMPTRTRAKLWIKPGGYPVREAWPVSRKEELAQRAKRLFSDVNNV